MTTKLATYGRTFKTQTRKLSATCYWRNSNGSSESICLCHKYISEGVYNAVLKIQVEIYP